jgi:hypothetical protein
VSSINIYESRGRCYIVPVSSSTGLRLPNYVPRDATLVHVYELAGLYLQLVAKYLIHIKQTEGPKAIWNLILDLPLMHKVIISAAVQDKAIQ